MALPTPEVPLQDACSTMFNNTLYTYMHDAFQALPLVHGAEWSMLPMGVAVSGGVCVKSTPKNDTAAAALYIVGGTSNSTDYLGLQRFVFANQTWETIKPSVAVTQARLYHSAVYLNSSDSILVYAGTQDGTKEPSSQTFTIQASEPYTVTAYEAIAPPAISPMLMQWTESKAIYIGGSETNTKAMIFSPSKSWVDSNASLANPIYNTSAIRAVVINGDDSSKTIYTFDPTMSPNEVNRTILIDANGNPVTNAAPIVSRDLDNYWEESSAKRVKRGHLTVANWPAYNGTLAPSSTRKGFAISSDQSGLVVISGGNENDVLCMFKARDNCWANATAVLSSKTVAQQGIGPSDSATSTASSTATSTASSSAAASSNGSGTPFPVKILGIVLGSILGIAIILIALLAFLRWRKKREQYFEAGHQRRASGFPDEKDPMDFQDRGLPDMISTRQFQGHEAQASQGSFSSMAILMGRVNNKKEEDRNGGDAGSQLNKNYISKPMPIEDRTVGLGVTSRADKGVSFAEAQQEPSTSRPRQSNRGGSGRRGTTRRSSGWNGYWSGGSGMNILGFGSKRTTYGSDRSSDSQSNYSEGRRLPSQVTQVSALVPPLKIGERPELNRVQSGSPTVAYHNNLGLPKEMSGHISRTSSVSSMSSYNEDRHDAFSSGIPASINEQQTWTPVDGPGWSQAVAPSNYSESVYAPTVGRSTVNFPAPPNRDTQFPGQPLYPPHASAKYQRTPAQQSSDMSWLNLGGNSRI